jgi:tetratricopeptide (TPR) repeat protein
VKQNQPTVALAMIVRGVDIEAPLLARCLASVNTYVDAIYLNVNHRKGETVSEKVLKVAGQYTKNVFITEWTDNFVMARSFIFDQVPKKYDWLMWLDSDDTVKNPQKIKDVIAIASQSIAGLYIQYDYAHDEYGNCTVTHWICRLCRNDGSYKWQSSIDDGGVAVHETLVATRTVNKARNNEFKVIHNSNPERRAESLQRNITLLEGMYDRQAKTKSVDPRILYYLATHYFDSGRLDRTEELLMAYIKVSGWAEERSEAWVYLGLCFIARERNDAARQAFLHAIGENPGNPRPYVELGQLEFIERRYLTSEKWLKFAVNMEEPETTSVILPMENQYRAYMLLAQTYINMGFSKLDEATKYVQKALELRPTDPGAKGAQKLVENLQKVKGNTKAVVRMARIFKDEDKPEKILPVLDMLPADLQDNPAVITLRQKYQKPKIWEKKSIAIFCGNSAEGIWGPWGLKDGGMGGSEEAVIQLSNEMAKRGWQVTVYATPGSRAGLYHPEDNTFCELNSMIGRSPADTKCVEWKQYWEFNPKDKFDVFIAWRMPWWFDIKVKARRTFLWLHDVMDKAEFTPERLANIDKVIFVSEYHAELYDGTIPMTKWFISGNGIDPTQFEDTDGKYDRDLHRCLYMSSHVRGLELLYDIWPEVKKAVPDATLDVYYGWKTFDAANKDNPERMAYKEKMLKWARELDGVEDRGRIGHDEIAAEIQKSGALAYPCTFPEVYNISTVKAIAGGATPITSDFGCLPDYAPYCTQVHLGKDRDTFKRQYARVLINHLRAPQVEATRQHNALEARKKYSWSNTAEGWDRVML